MMSSRQILLLTSGLCMAAPAFPAAASAELPGGEVFRARRLSWSASVPEPLVSHAPLARRANREVVALPRLSSRFGHRFHPIRQVMAIHSGIDIPGPLGTPVQASASGRVRFAGNAGGYGKMVEIDHGNGLATRYAHLSRILTTSGGAVAQGEMIALMGSTGRSTGSHLHFEVREYGRAADPLAYFSRNAGMVAALPALDYNRLPTEPSAPHLSQFARSRDAARATPGDGFRATTRSLP